MKYSELVEGETTKTERQEFLTGGEMTAITIRIPKKNLKETADVSQGVDCAGRVAEIRARRASSRFFSNWGAAYDALLRATGVPARRPHFESEAASVDDARTCFERYVGDWSAIDTSYRDFGQASRAAAMPMAE